MLNHDSGSRERITEISVFEEQTLKNIIIDLRMAHYFEACKIKREKWLGMIGSITFEEAYNSNIDGFEKICGRHTHTLNKEQFWGLVRAAKSNPEKKAVFLKKVVLLLINVLKKFNFLEFYKWHNLLFQ